MNKKSCKDCLHYEACESYSKRESFATLYCAEECPGFTDKSEWVHLPCRVGDIIYCFAPCFDTDHHPKLKVVEKQIIELKTIATVFGLNFDIDNIGKTIFLNREEAEKALEERGKENE